MKIIIESSDLQPLFDRLMKSQFNLDNCQKTDCSNVFIVSEVLGMLQRIVYFFLSFMSQSPYYTVVDNQQHCIHLHL